LYTERQKRREAKEEAKKERARKRELKKTAKKAKKERKQPLRKWPKMKRKSVCITGWFKNRMHMVLLIHAIGWQYHPRIKPYTANVVIGFGHDDD